ncbi:hypothetical protein DACRYDRAFT_44696 [Dacryopinax primogenitus]|uniref:Rrn7/TAF1B C-terminal cyclin domain-containing protein n=1 Tax=Dacryopinax primogenitus (strain DJM 731) TaxID=1858805 RepID=M5GFD9_DACPD|nr:uncharacterized protein DACRYDRAFT_44696 [Dacryopinax primogenitus]EJU06182.1 hypothetical protein DACRYDRAFT_44696 [Dacryopinax primogenitus]
MVRACPICKSRRWHREPLSGLIVCSEGHVLANYRNENNELLESGPHLLHKRSLKRPKRTKVHASNADPKLYHGDRARFHYLQCLQLLFRHQVSTLIRIWSLPPEFEIICRDTWALHVLLWPKIPDEPVHHAHATSSSDISQHAQVGRPEQPAREETVPRTEDEPASEAESEESEENSDLAGLLSEASGSSSEDEAHRSQSGPEGPAQRIKARKRRAALHEGDAATPRGNLSVLMCALYLLRVPVTYADILRHTYALPYLAPSHHLPPEMTQHLTKSTIQGLSPKFPPKARKVHALASRLARNVWLKYGIRIPELNAAPVLWRAVRALNGSPLLYTLSKRLLAALDIPLTLHPSLVSLPSNSPPTPPTLPPPRRHPHENIPPELGLICGVVLALKLLYGLDGTPRLPRDDSDRLAGMPELGPWLDTLKQAKEKTTRDLYTAPSEMGVLQMSDEETDAYLSFAQHALVDPRPSINKPEDDLLPRFFPLPSVPRPDAHGDHIGPSSAFPSNTDFTATPLSRDPAALQPGNKHVVYSHLDKNGTVPEEYELVLQTAAGWARVEEQDVLTVVEVYERRLERGWRKERRKRRLESGEEREKEVRHRSRSALRAT